jgi:hypothetical protein
MLTTGLTATSPASEQEMQIISKRFYAEGTGTKSGVAQTERNKNCDLVPASSNDYIARCSITFMLFGNIVDWHAYVSTKHEVT